MHEVADKVKQKWEIKPQYESYLLRENFEDMESAVIAAPRPKKKSAAPEGEEAAAGEKEVEAEGASVSASKPKAKVTKRKRDGNEEGVEEGVETDKPPTKSPKAKTGASANTASVEKKLAAPKPALSSFILFCNEKSEVAKNQMGTDIEARKSLLREMWSALSPEDVDLYNAKEAQDRARSVT